MLAWLAWWLLLLGATMASGAAGAAVCLFATAFGAYLARRGD